MTAQSGSLDHVFDSSEALANGAAEWLCTKAVASTGRFAICCSGGSTPRRMYELLARPDIKSRFPWGRVHWFWGDERFVPHDDPDSNYGMTYAALFLHVDIPGGNIHPVPTSDRSPEQAAAEYERTLGDYYGEGDLHLERPLFDVAFLGIGEDGHTASLFPGHPALDEKRRWALAVVGARPQARVTLTYPTLDSSKDVVFLAAGGGKRAVVARARAGDRALPAARIKPVGNLHWFLDRAAAG